MSGSTQYVGPNAVYPGLPEQTCLQQIIPAYVYTEYADDDNIQAFNTSYNNEATQFLLWFNTLNLPIYTGGIVSGALLDWVGQGLYGISRPSITTGEVLSFESINQTPIDAQVINGRKITNNEVLQSTTDDIYRRVLTWNLYKGDGFIFNMQWLKRRIVRFMNGADGISPTIDNTAIVSISVSGTVFTVAIDTPTPSVGTQLGSLINSGACIIPFQYSFVISASTNLVNSSGVLHVMPATGYPTSPSGLVFGAVWSNSGVVTVVPGVTPNPSAAPVYFGAISSAQLLVLGGGNLPTTAPTSGSLQLWNNSGVVNVA